jgi:hypothetical protein
MIQADAARILELLNQSQALEAKIDAMAQESVITRAKAAMMIAVDRHRKGVPESQRFYEKKRAEGKKHNQAIRALGRQLCRVIYKLLKEERAYKIRD